MQPRLRVPLLSRPARCPQISAGAAAVLVFLLLVLLWLGGWEGKKCHDAELASPGLCNEGEAMGGVQVGLCLERVLGTLGLWAGGVPCLFWISCSL